MPIQTLKVGALGTHRTLGLAKAKRAAFLLASTSEVYGDPLVHPQREDYWATSTRSAPRVYDEAKRFAEASRWPTTASTASTPHRAHLQHLRRAHAAGRRPRDPRLHHAGPRRQPITVYGDGSQTRSFQYISDLVDGIWRLMQGAGHGPGDIGNPHEMTLLALAEKIRRLSGSPSEIVFEPLPEDDPKVRQPDIGRARTLLGWEPRVAVDEGLGRTIAWFRTRLARA